MSEAEHTEYVPKGGKQEETSMNIESTDEKLPADESVSDTEEPPPTNYKPQTLEMEVHAHELHKAPGHGWKHYFFEFLMLFLAVTLGFFVENMRERIVESHRENEFIHSFSEDLKKDITQLDTRIKQRETQRSQMDSLTEMLSSPDPDQYGSQIYYFSRYLPRPYRFFSNDATMQQLKNAGNLRLIRKQAVVDTILAYDQKQLFMNYIQEREESLVQRIFDHLNILFDTRVFDQMILNDIEFARPPGNPPLKTKDKTAILGFISDIHYLKTVNTALIGNFTRQLERAKTTLAFIQKEYQLE